MQNSSYWPYVLNVAGSFSKAKYKHKSEKKLIRYEINTQEKYRNSTVMYWFWDRTEERLRMNRSTRSFWLEEEIIKH